MTCVSAGWLHGVQWVLCTAFWTMDVCVCLPVWGCVWRHNCPEPPLFKHNIFNTQQFSSKSLLLTFSSQAKNDLVVFFSVLWAEVWECKITDSFPPTDRYAPFSATYFSNNVKLTEKTIKNDEKVLFPHGNIWRKKVNWSELVTILGERRKDHTMSHAKKLKAGPPPLRLF